MCMATTRGGKKCGQSVPNKKKFCFRHCFQTLEQLQGGETQFHMRYDKNTKMFQLLRNKVVVFENFSREAVEELFNDLWKLEREEQIRLGLF